MRIRLAIAAAVATLLASVGLYPLFETLGWFGTGLGATVVVALAGVLTRRFRLPAVACLAVGVLALLAYLTALFSPGPALLAVVPTPGSVSALGRLLGDGWREANSYAAPVPSLPGVELLSCVGIGVVAVLADFLAVRIRRAAPAGLPLLALYSVPAAVREEGAGWLIFLLGAAGYLTLLVADARERLSGWGRPVFTRHWPAGGVAGERPDSSALAVTGRRVGLTAVAVAIVVPLAVPGIQPRGLLGTAGGGGTGPTTVTTPDPLVSLKRQLVRSDDAVVLTYRTSDDIAPDYLRMYSLDRFDGQGWTYSPMHGDRNARVQGRTLPVAPGLSGTAVRPVSTKIMVDPGVRGMSVLPAPYPPTKVSIKGDWRVDTPSLMIFSLHDAAGGRTYTVSSARPVPTYQQLETAPPPPAGITGRYLTLPRLPSDVVALAHKITATASTPYDRATKLQEWFTRPGNFTYSLDTPAPRGVDALHDFLFTGKTGYCEQFAASMALLARIVGVPARVGVGYTAGTRQANGTWVVRTKDTHAWPELYFSGVGWLRFEPTPAGGGGQGSATVPDYATPPPLPGTPDGGVTSRLPSGAGLTGGGPAPATAAQRHRGDGLDNTGSAGPPPAAGHRGLPVAWLLILVPLALLLVSPAVLRRVAARRRWAGTSPGGSVLGIAMPGALRRGAARRRAGTPPDAAVAHAAWDELRAAALDFGLPWRSGDSPRAAARRLGAARRFGGRTRAALDRLVRAEELARYAPVAGPATGLRDDVRTVRAAFAAGSPRRVRWRARLFPPSAVVTLRHAAGRLLDAVERLDSLRPRLRRRAHG